MNPALVRPPQTRSTVLQSTVRQSTVLRCTLARTRASGTGPSGESSKQCAGGATRARGFTLIEVLVVVALMGVLAAFAVPSLQLYLDRNRLRSYSNELLASLQYAKAEALARGGGVSLCPKLYAGKTTCTAPLGSETRGFVTFSDAYFQGGWFIGFKNDPDALRKINRDRPANLRVAVAGNNPLTTSFDFDSLGRPIRQDSSGNRIYSQGMTFMITSYNHCRVIYIEPTGLIRMDDETRRRLTATGAQSCDFQPGQKP